MARSAPSTFAHRLRQRLRAYRWRRVGGLAAVALALSLMLVGYLFGFDNYFITRLLTAFFVGFSLLALTFLGILPFIGWAATHWFGAGWAREVDTALPRTTPATRPVAARTTTT